MTALPIADWLATPLGHYVLAWECARHDQLVADIFGFNAVQIGLSQVDLLRANRMPLRFHYGDPAFCSGGEVRGEAQQLPFPANSIDLVLLPHVLEFAADPHQILREVERVLVPEGSVVVSGFNPFSLWGLRRKLGGQTSALPWPDNPIALPRLKDWFKVLGLEPRGGAFGCYAPAPTQHRERTRWLEYAGERWWPVCGAVYLLQAVKRLPGIRLIHPQLKARRAAVRALAPLAHRVDTQKNLSTPYHHERRNY